jgi:hypothetical protein
MSTPLNKIPGHLVQIGESFEQKYKPVLDFDGWRVAMLRHSEATDINTFNRIERHNETHEVFILTTGSANLIIGGKGKEPGDYEIVPMRHNVAYNILPGVWHHAILSETAHIILFERSDTGKENSDYHFPDQFKLSGLRNRINTNYSLK